MLRARSTRKRVPSAIARECADITRKSVASSKKRRESRPARDNDGRNRQNTVADAGPDTSIGVAVLPMPDHIDVATGMVPVAPLGEVEVNMVNENKPSVCSRSCFKHS